MGAGALGRFEDPRTVGGRLVDENGGIESDRPMVSAISSPAARLALRARLARRGCVGGARRPLERLQRRLQILPNRRHGEK